MGSDCARALRAEVHRLRSLRSQVVLLGIAVLGAIAMGTAQVFALPAGAAGSRVVGAGVSGAEISPFFVGLGAALFAAADLSSRQFALTLLQLNNRVLVSGAKIVVLSAAALLTAGVVIAFVVPVVIVHSGWSAVGAPTTWLVVPGLHVLFALLGGAIGLVTRSVVAAVFAYLAVVWALPVVVAVIGIWVPAVSGPVLQFAPVTLTAAMLEPSTAFTAVVRFGALDVVLLAVGLVRVLGWRIR